MLALYLKIATLASLILRYTVHFCGQQYCQESSQTQEQFDLRKPSAGTGAFAQDRFLRQMTAVWVPAPQSCKYLRCNPYCTAEQLRMIVAEMMH